MKYSGKFRSVLKNKEYKVEIVTNDSSVGTIDITLGPNAFTTSMDNGSSTIYSPIKCQSASIEIVSKDYYFDLYAKKPKQNTVILKDSASPANVLFAGYVSCNVYNADYNFETETWRVECVDRLSVLKNFDYTPINGNTKDFVSFADIIRHCLVTAGFDSNDRWYISKTTHRPGKSYLVDNLYISEANFFDEDDTPMKMFDVLSEVCKYMGVTAVQDGKYVYFIDYDAIANGNNQYTYYRVGSTLKYAATLDSSISITNENYKERYASTGSSLSLDNVYSKVTVRDNLYPVKSIIPSLFNDEDLRNVHYVDENDQRWNEEPADRQCVFGGKESWLQTREKRAEDDVYFYIKSRFYENTKYTHNYYDNNGDSSTTAKIMNGLHAEQLLGASFTKYNIGSGNTPSEAYAGLEYDNFDNYLMLTNNYSLKTGLKRIEAKTDDSKPFFMSGKTKIVVKGEMIPVDRGKFPNSPTSGNNANIGYWPHTGTFTSEYDGDFWHGISLEVEQSIINLKIGLKIGNVVDKTFNVPFYPIGKGNERLKEDKKHAEIFYKSFGVQDSVTYSDNIKEKGYKLDMGISDSSVIAAKPLISIYGMDDMVEAFGQNGLLGNSILACVFIKDFDVVAVDPFEGGDEGVLSTDTEYCYTVDDEYAQELSPIDFKITTADGKSLNYSSVAWKDPSTGKYEFVDTLVNDSLAPYLAAENESTAKRSEELMCFKLVKQYQKPRKKLELNLFNDLIKPWTKVSETLSPSFIVNTLAYDYAYDAVRVELVEKKYDY